MQADLRFHNRMKQADLRRFEIDDREWVLEQHAFHYARDEGFDASFGVLVGKVLDGFLTTNDPVKERGWIAHSGSTRLGSIFCSHIDDQTAQLRIFFLMPEARGRGLGKRLLRTCTDHARDHGYQQMRLWTHESHRAACALYLATGWQLEDSTPQQSFGQNVIVQNWRFTL